MLSSRLLFWISLLLLPSVSVCARLECEVGREHALKVCDSLLVEDLSVVRGKRDGMDGEGETARAGVSDSKIGRFSGPLILSFDCCIVHNRQPRLVLPRFYCLVAMCVETDSEYVERGGRPLPCISGDVWADLDFRRRFSLLLSACRCFCGVVRIGLRSIGCEIEVEFFLVS